MEPGLRERKKRRTREAIAEVARSLFLDRGFDAVTVTEIAAAAEVSQQTVFNHFRTKEDLFYDRLESFQDEMLAAVRDRAPGESVVAAFARFVSRPRGALSAGDDESAEQLRLVSERIAESPALLGRERDVLDGYAGALTGLIADETRASAGDLRPRTLATALIAIHRGLIDEVRAAALAGEDPERLRRRMRASAKQAFEALEVGYGDYAIRDAESPR